MATYESVEGCITLEASADLSTKQFFFVKIDTNAQIAVAALGDFAVGVLYDNPSAQGKVGMVAPLGGRKTRVIAGTTITKGDFIKSDANGKAGVAVKANGAGITGSNVLGIALESAAANEIFTMLGFAAGAVPTTLA